MDTTILNTALPTLVRQLHTNDSQLEWILDAYTVVFAGLLLTAGALGDRFGRRGALMSGLALFGLASMACALSGTAGPLIGGRAFAGVGAALIFPATLSILTNLYTDAGERQKAIAVWAGAAGLGIALGPIVAGALLQHFDWNSVFWINVPVCFTALVAARVFLPSSQDSSAVPSFDPPGTLLSIVGLSSLVFGIIDGPTRGWTSGPVLAAFAVALVVLPAFLVTERRRGNPMLDLELFANRRFSIACFAMAALYFCLFGMIYYMTQDLQFYLGYGPLAAGLRILPFAAVLLFVANATPRVVERVGAGIVIAAGLAVVAVADMVFGASVASNGYGWLLVSQCLLAFGMGLVIAPATALIMGSVPPNRAGVGSAVNDTTRQVGGAFGVAVMGSLGSSLYRRAVASQLTSAQFPPTVVAQARRTFGGALVVAHTLAPADADRLRAIARHAFVRGVGAAAAAGFSIALAGAVISTRLLRSHPSRALPASLPPSAADDVALARDSGPDSEVRPTDRTGGPS